jgi:hypothetical protein
MDIDGDDDFYAPEESVQEASEPPEKVEEAPAISAQTDEDEDLEEGEEEDEADDGSDSVWADHGMDLICAHIYKGHRYHYRTKRW